MSNTFQEQAISLREVILDNTDKVWGEFELPTYKTLDEYEDVPEDTIKSIKGIKGNKPERIREVSYVANTPKELRGTLPDELKGLP